MANSGIGAITEFVKLRGVPDQIVQDEKVHYK